MPEKLTGKFLNIFKVLLAVLLVSALIYFGIVDVAVLQTIAHNPGILLILILLCFVMHLISIVRWQILLFCQGIEILNRQAAKSVFLALSLNSFLPGGGISGDAVRMAYITKKAPDRKAEAVLSVFMDRALGFYGAITLGVFSGIFLFIQGVHDEVFVSLVIAAIIGFLGIPIMGLVLFIFIKRNESFRRFMWKEPVGKIRAVALRIVNSLDLYLQSPGKLFQAFVLSLIIHTLVFGGMMVLGDSLGIEGMTAMGYSFATFCGVVGNLIPITPGGLGVGEVAFDRVSHLLANGAASGFGTVFFGYRVFSLVAILLGLVISFFPQGVLKVVAPTSSSEET